MYRAIINYVNHNEDNREIVLFSRQSVNEWMASADKNEYITNNSITVNEYEDGYCSSLGITIVKKMEMSMKYSTEEIIGWYHGEPEDMETLCYVFGSNDRMRAYYDIGYKDLI